jgi:hypothetical protein
VRRAAILTLLVAVFLVSGMGWASAHVHGITPLRCVGVEDDGAQRTDDTPAAAPGGPISGLIPSSTLGSPGNSHLIVGDGGFDTPACPAS